MIIQYVIMHNIGIDRLQSDSNQPIVLPIHQMDWQNTGKTTVSAQACTRPVHQIDMPVYLVDCNPMAFSISVIGRSSS